MEYYHKIKTVHNRDMEGTKKLIETQFRDPLVEYLKDNKWIAKEKIDGTNICVHWDGHKVSFHGRNDISEMRVSIQEYLDKAFGSSEAEQMFEQLFGETEVFIYGEGFGKTIQKCGVAYNEFVSFICFDIKIGRYYLSMDKVETICKAFNVAVVPYFTGKTLMELIEMVRLQPLSELAMKNTGTEIVSEGFVAIPEQDIFDRAGKRIIVKIRTRDYK